LGCLTNAKEEERRRKKNEEVCGEEVSELFSTLRKSPKTILYPFDLII